MKRCLYLQGADVNINEIDIESQYAYNKYNIDYDSFFSEYDYFNHDFSNSGYYKLNKKPRKEMNEAKDWAKDRIKSKYGINVKWHDSERSDKVGCAVFAIIWIALMIFIIAIDDRSRGISFGDIMAYIFFGFVAALVLSCIGAIVEKIIEHLRPSKHSEAVYGPIVEKKKAENSALIEEKRAEFIKNCEARMRNYLSSNEGSMRSLVAYLGNKLIDELSKLKYDNRTVDLVTDFTLSGQDIDCLKSVALSINGRRADSVELEGSLTRIAAIRGAENAQGFLWALTVMVADYVMTKLGGKDPRVRTDICMYFGQWKDMQCGMMYSVRNPAYVPLKTL